MRGRECEMEEETMGLQGRNPLLLVENNTSSNLLIFQQEKAISRLKIFSLKYQVSLIFIRDDLYTVIIYISSRNLTL